VLVEQAVGDKCDMIKDENTPLIVAPPLGDVVETSGGKRIETNRVVSSSKPSLFRLRKQVCETLGSTYAATLHARKRKSLCKSRIAVVERS